jgi:hypothetical protein
MPALGRVHSSNIGKLAKHNCEGCVLCLSHPSSGPSLHGSPNVFVNGTPVLRATGPSGGPPDGGTHNAGQCCGDNKWICAMAENRGVYINGYLAFCETDKTKHDNDGTFGSLVVNGTKNVFVGS